MQYANTKDADGNMLAKEAVPSLIIEEIRAKLEMSTAGLSNCFTTLGVPPPGGKYMVPRFHTFFTDSHGLWSIDFSFLVENYCVDHQIRYNLPPNYTAGESRLDRTITQLII